MIIHYVSGPCGSRKTYAAERYMIPFVRKGEKFVVTQPSNRLLNQTAANLRRLDPGLRIVVIHTGKHRDVVRTIDEYLKSPEAKHGQVLLITQQALGRLEHFWNRQDWHLILDEIPQVHAGFVRRLAHNNFQLMSLIEAKPFDDLYSVVTAKAVPHLDEVATNKTGDEVWGLFSDLVAKCRHLRWQVYCLTENWKQLERNSDEGAEVRDFQAFALLDHEMYAGFRTLTIMGANFTDSLLYQIWSKRGVTFIQHRQIKPEWDTHSNGHLLDVLYVTEGQWSREMRKSAHGGEDALTLIARAIEARLAGERFVWMGNNDIRVSPFVPGSSERLPNSPLGLNEYSHFHAAVMLSSLNPSPAYFQFMKHMVGLDSGAVRTGIYLETIYQGGSRISLRDRESAARKTIVVMDRDAAEWLLAMYPGATIAPLSPEPIIPARTAGRPKKRNAMTGAQRIAALRARRKAGREAS